MFWVVWYDLDPWPSNFIQDHCTPSSHRNSMGEVWVRLDHGDRRYALDRDFIYNLAMTLALDLETCFKVIILFIQGHSLGEVWARLDHGERRYDPDNDFVYTSALLFTFDLETQFKVTAHLFPKTFCGWSMSQIGPRGMKICPGQVITDTQTDGGIDRQTNHYRAPAENCKDYSQNISNVDLIQAFLTVHSLGYIN